MAGAFLERRTRIKGYSDSADYADYAACIGLVDADGKVVSLAFDGRYFSEAWCSGMDKHTYRVFSDCPVIDGFGRQFTDSAPLAVMRNLRDALNDLNLGD